MLDDGMVNHGQLLTETHADGGVKLIGFGSYHGTVIAGRYWGDEMKKMQVPPAKKGSWEYMLHHASQGKDTILLTSEMKDEDSMGYQVPETYPFGV